VLAITISGTNSVTYVTTARILANLDVSRPRWHGIERRAQLATTGSVVRACRRRCARPASAAGARISSPIARVR